MAAGQPTETRSEAGPQLLLVRAGARLCALPLDAAAETLRPLPVERLGGVPAFVAGVTVLRGAPAPVVDLALLLGLEDATPRGRFVSLRVGEGRRAALAVREVVGVRRVGAERLREAPPLLSRAGEGALEALAGLEEGLLFLLEAGRLVPTEVWAALEEHPS